MSSTTALQGAADGSRQGLKGLAAELGQFALKEAQSCLFAGLFFASVLLVPRAGLFGVPRYDL